MDIAQKGQNTAQTAVKKVKDVYKTTNELGQMIDKLNKSASEIGEIVSSIVKVKDQINQIATAVEQQSAISEEVTRNIEQSARIASEIETLAEQIVRDSYDILRISSDLRHTSSAVKTKKTQEILFDIFKGDHERMMLRIQAHIRGMDKLDPEKLSDYRSCGAGKWYYGEEVKKFKELPGFTEFEDIHKLCHTMGRDIVIDHNSGDHEKVKKLLEEMKRDSERLNNIMDRLKSGYLARIR